MEKTVLKANEYECAHCHKIYENGQTVEEALAQTVTNFGKAALDTPLVVLCDDCYNLIMTNIQN